MVAVIVLSVVVVSLCTICAVVAALLADMPTPDEDKPQE
jgi:hypothetical protein